MSDLCVIEQRLLKEIEEEKGFSFRKLMKIISLDGIYREMQYSSAISDNNLYYPAYPN